MDEKKLTFDELVESISEPTLKKLKDWITDEKSIVICYQATDVDKYIAGCNTDDVAIQRRLLVESIMEDILLFASLKILPYYVMDYNILKQNDYLIEMWNLLHIPYMSSTVPQGSAADLVLNKKAQIVISSTPSIVMYGGNHLISKKLFNLKFPSMWKTISSKSQLKVFGPLEEKKHLMLRVNRILQSVSITNIQQLIGELKTPNLELTQFIKQKIDINQIAINGNRVTLENHWRHPCESTVTKFLERFMPQDEATDIAKKTISLIKTNFVEYRCEICRKILRTTLGLTQHKKTYHNA